MSIPKGKWLNDGRMFSKKSEAKKLAEDMKFERGYNYRIVKTKEDYHCKFMKP